VFLRLVGASDLIAMDRGGTSDPYVVVRLDGGQKQTSSVVKKTLSPKWDQSFDFVVADRRTAELTFEVFDEDKFTRDDFLGRVSLPVSMIQSATSSRWLRLEGVASGSINIIVGLKHITDIDPKGRGNLMLMCLDALTKAAPKTPLLLSKPSFSKSQLHAWDATMRAITSGEEHSYSTHTHTAQNSTTQYNARERETDRRTHTHTHTHTHTRTHAGEHRHKHRSQVPRRRLRCTPWTRRSSSRHSSSACDSATTSDSPHRWPRTCGLLYKPGTPSRRRQSVLGSMFAAYSTRVSVATIYGPSSSSTSSNCFPESQTRSAPPHFPALSKSSARNPAWELC